MSLDHKWTLVLLEVESRERSRRTDVSAVQDGLLQDAGEAFGVAEAHVEALPRERVDGVRCVADQDRSRSFTLADVLLGVVEAQGERSGCARLQ